MRTVLFISLLFCLCPAGAGACGDEIIFKEKFGGGKVKCEIYKEDEDYIHYIDIKKKMDCGCSREIVAEIVREDGELIDVEKFFLDKAREAKDEQAREKAEKLAEELRKKREAAEAEKNRKTGEKVVGKLKIRPPSSIKVITNKAGGSNELLVDPFPEEGDGPASPKKGK